MKKIQFSSLLLIFSLLLSSLAPVYATEETETAVETAPVSIQDSMSVAAEYAILYDGNHGEILFDQNGQERAYPASTTKVMTALLVMEAIAEGQLTADQLITCTAAALVGITSDASTQNISVGESLSVTDLLYCLLLPSANEAANILAIAVDGDVATFVARMNEKATQLGCIDTNFVNTNGLHDDNHYTTALDIALIMAAALEYDLFRTIIITPVYTTAATELKAERTFYNTNGLVSSWYYSGYYYAKAIGGKTGTTPQAGRCLVAAAEDPSSGEMLISVVFGTEAVTNLDGSVDYQNFSESSRLLEWGFQNFQRTTVSPDNSIPVASVAVTLSEEGDEVLVRPQGTIERTLPIDITIDDFDTEINLFQDSVEAPVNEGDVLGTYTVSYQGEVYGVLDLVAVTSLTSSSLLEKKDQFVELFALKDTLTTPAFSVTPAMIIAAVAALVLIFSLFILLLLRGRGPRGGGRNRQASRKNYSGRR